MAFAYQLSGNAYGMEQEMAEWAAAIRVAYRFIEGYHVYTSDDVYGLYVANQDAGKAYQAITHRSKS